MYVGTSEQYKSSIIPTLDRVLEFYPERCTPEWKENVLRLVDWLSDQAGRTLDLQDIATFFDDDIMSAMASLSMLNGMGGLIDIFPVLRLPDGQFVRYDDLDISNDVISMKSDGRKIPYTRQQKEENAFLRLLVSPTIVRSPPTLNEEGVLKTSAEWVEDAEGACVIMDPDGWDRANYQFSFHEEKISKAEFERRLSTSTILLTRKGPVIPG